MNELEGISPLLAEMERINVFTIPNGYFNTLSSNVLDSLEFSGDPINISKVNSPFSVPEGYFENFSYNILSAIKNSTTEAEKEIKELSPVLAGLRQKPTFSLPKNYFEELSFKIVAKLPATARVIKMGRPAFLRYAVAAVVTGLMGLSLFSVFNNRSATTTYASPYTAQVLQQAKQIEIQNSFESELETLTGADIEQYLKKSGQNVEAALVASTTDDANLPSQEEYLYNANTLDDFLKTMNLNN
ncbi:MAG: hypothetical protein ABIY51_00610 [Ferruginibacter sp.]